MWRRVSRRALVLGGVAAITGLGIRTVLRQSPAPFGDDPLATLPMRITRRTEWGAAHPLAISRLEPGAYDPVINRSGWRVYDAPLTTLLRTIAVHHSALPGSDGPAQIQALHQGTRGFADIAYHFLVNADGTVFEGRDLRVRGAHVGGHNTGTIGVCLLGNFETSQPSSLQLAALDELTVALRTAFGLSHLAGHRDFPGNRTVCPGATLWPNLPDLAARAGLRHGIAL